MDAGWSMTLAMVVDLRRRKERVNPEVAGPVVSYQAVRAMEGVVHELAQIDDPETVDMLGVAVGC